jgi:hypothetical protein
MTAAGTVAYDRGVRGQMRYNRMQIVDIAIAVGLSVGLISLILITPGGPESTAGYAAAMVCAVVQGG